MIVSNTAVVMLVCVVVVLFGLTPGISPGGGGGGGVDVVLTVGTSLVTDPEFTPGISPANAVLERTHANVIAITSFFMNCLL